MYLSLYGRVDQIIFKSLNEKTIIKMKLAFFFFRSLQT